MRVLFIYPKIGGGNPWTPLGIASIAAYLQKYGIEVKIIDNNLHKWDKERLSILINEYAPDVVGISGMTVQCNDALELGKIVKDINKDLKLIYGGVHFTVLPEDGLKYGDVSVIGEGEQTFLELCGEDDLHKVRGIAFKEKNKIILTEPRPFIDNLDEIPFPAYDLLEMEKYHDELTTGEKAISMMTARGCPYNCTFCASPQLFKRRVRFHSVDYVISHIKYLIESYNLKNLKIEDDTFTVSKKRVLEFCEKMEEGGFDLNITCLTNVQQADGEMFKKMKTAGVSMVSIGIESGNDNILKMINKGFTVDDARKAVAMAKKAGLDTECLFIIGNIGENKSTIMDSINFAKEINPIGSNSHKNTIYNWFQFMTPFPGSELFGIYEQYGYLTTKNWDEYHHQKPIFIPKDLDENSMVQLRELALEETNYQRFSWAPRMVKRNALVQRIYRSLMINGD